MTCREFVDFVMQYLDGELALNQRQHFEAHLAECPDCVRYLEQYRATVAAVNDQASEVPVTIPEDLVQAIVTARDLQRRCD
jgi:anti-sigma factor RsiW